MQQTRTRGLRVPLVATALAAALCSGACQDVHTFVTGEQFVAPPEESPRVEVELVVEVPDAFYDALEGEDRDELEQAIAERVLSLADLGMRFYPVPTSEYGGGDAIVITRYDYHMTQETENAASQPYGREIHAVVVRYVNGD